MRSRAIQHHRHDRLCRSVRPDRGVRRASMAEQPGRDACAQPRRAEKAVADADHRGGGEAAAVRCRARLDVAARNTLAAGCSPRGRLREDRGSHVDRTAGRAHRDRGERADPLFKDHRLGPARDVVGDAGRWNEGGHYSRQRRRRCRRLRAAGRPGRCRAHAPAGQECSRGRGAAERARAGGGPDCRRAHRQALGRQGGDARGRGGRRPEARARRDRGHAFACAAQGR